MAIRPEIALQTRVPDVGSAINNALINAQRLQGMQQSREEAPLRNRLLEAQVGSAEQEQSAAIEQQRIASLVTGAAELTPLIQDAKVSGDLGPLARSLGERRARLIEQGKPTNDTDEAFAMLSQGPEGLGRLEQATSSLTNLGFQTGILNRGQRIGTASSRDFDQFQQLQDQAQLTGDPADSEKARQFGVQAGFLPEERARIAAEQAGGVARARADVQAETAPGIAGAVEGAKIEGAAKAKAKSAPAIARAESLIRREVKLAEKAATEQGEVLTDLARAQAALPGLTEVVGQLRELAPIATSTFAGRVFDTAVKELGFGATKGATASTKFGAMVNNQVLPLLKPTFGAAFTVQEGEALRETMGNKDASVEEKMATLDAFIEQKTRDIQVKQRQLGQEAPEATNIGRFQIEVVQ